MDLRDLVSAIVAGDLIAARQFVADARRSGMRWDDVAMPRGIDRDSLSIAAALVELFASRAGLTPPAWTAAIGAVTQPMTLDPGLDRMPRSFARAKASGPEPLRRRNLIALPDFLDVA